MSNLKINGTSMPVVGVKEIYSVLHITDSKIPQNQLYNDNSSVFENQIKWFIYVLDRGKWRLAKGNEKTGETVDFTFTQTSLKWKEMKMIVHAYGQKAMIDIKPQKASQGKILYVELLDKNYKIPTRPFAYGDWIIARVHCVDMELLPVKVILWEDDGGKTRQNTTNIKIESKEGDIINGTADVAFYLNPSHMWLANAKLAPGDKNEGEFHEYYVTAEIFEKVSKRTPSKNANVPNPDYKPEIPKQPIPAEQKGPSKKETKGIAKSNKKVHDYHEQKVAVKKEVWKDPFIETINSLMTVNVDDLWGSKKTGNCVCKENNFYWSDKLTCDERKKVLEVCANIWGEDKKKDKASELMAIMHLETIKTFSPSKKGVSKNGTKFIGLIQFSATTAKSIGTTYEALGEMTFVEQMKYVEKYLKQNKDKMTTIVDFYLQVIKPGDVGKGNQPDHAVFDESISVPDGDGRNTSSEQRLKNITREPWVTKYGYASNPTFMTEKDEKTLRKKWVYTRQRYEERYGTIGGKTTIKEIDDVLRNEHYIPGATQLFKGKCDDVVEEEKSKNGDNERAPWMKLAWIEEAKNLKETGKNKEIQKFFEGTPYEKSMKNGTENEKNVAWCAAFVNWIMTKYGYKGIAGYDAVRALKWASWDGGKDLGKPVYGAIAVKKRSGGGHVGFVAGKRGNKVIILGGNQSQKLHCAPYNVSDYFAYLVPLDYSITDKDYSLPEYEGNHGEVGSED